MKKIILPGIIFFFFVSCNNQTSIINKGPLNYKEAVELLTQKFFFEPDTLFMKQPEGTPKIIATRRIAGGYEMLFLHKKNESWEKYSSLEVNARVRDFEFVKIDSVEYIYYSTTETYFPGVTQTFELAESGNYQSKLSLIFRHWIKLPPVMEQVDGKLKKNRKLLDYIKTKKPVIALFDEMENGRKDLSLPLYMNDKWSKKNRRVYELLDAKKDSSINLYMPSYDYDLRWIYGEGEEDKKESEYYAVYSYFKSDLIGYNKKTNKYLLIWVPSWIYGWIEEIKFISPQIIIILDHDGKSFEINLLKSTIKALERSCL